jgi:hypothetical protein
MNNDAINSPDKKDLSITKRPTTNWWINWSIRITIDCPEYTGTADWYIWELAKSILDMYYGEWSSTILDTDFNVELNLNLQQQVLSEIVKNSKKVDNLTEECEELRLNNQELQQQVNNLKRKLEIIESGEQYLLDPLILKTSTLEIETADDFFSYIRERWIKRIVWLLYNYIEKEKTLEFFANLFQISWVPEDLRINSNKKFDFGKKSTTKSWTANDIIKKRIIEKTFAEHEWFSINEILENTSSKKFYQFILECFFAGVKLKP